MGQRRVPDSENSTYRRLRRLRGRSRRANVGDGTPTSLPKQRAAVAPAPAEALT
jgi:hypothetical protein